MISPLLLSITFKVKLNALQIKVKVIIAQKAHNQLETSRPKKLMANNIKMNHNFLTSPWGSKVWEQAL